MSNEPDPTNDPYPAVGGQLLDGVLVERLLSASFLDTIRSCDGCGDQGCCDPTCWYCHSPMGPENLRLLAQNLGTAGFLCTAWQNAKRSPSWEPGCGHAADKEP